MDGISLNKFAFKNHASVCAPFILAALLLLTVISSSLRSIIFPVAGICMLFLPSSGQSVWRAANDPVSRTMLLLYAWILLAFIWSEASWNQAFFIAGKYDKLLYLPLLAIGFQNAKARTWAIYAFLGGTFITAIFFLTNKLGLTYIMDKSSQTAIFYNHIITGSILAFGAYLSFFLATKKQNMERIVLIFLGILLSYVVLFLNTGRTGYVMYVVLMLVLMKQTLSLRQAVISSLIFAGIIVGCYYGSTVMHNGLNTAMHNVQDYRKSNENTSLGYRFQFHRYARSLFFQHPVIGHGTGSFAYNYNKDNPLPAWKSQYFEPHSQYWLFAVEQGTIGILLLGLFFIALFALAYRTKTFYGSILLAFIIMFGLGSSSDSLLLLSPLGWLLVVFAAISLGEDMEKSAKQIEK